MSKENPVNRSASIRQKLLNFAKAEKIDFQRVLDSYAAECLLDRVSRSEFSDKFLLKGALLFHVWSGEFFRPTRDIDFLGYGDNSVETVTLLFKSIAEILVPEDGMIFDRESITGERIKEDDDYEGVRVLITAQLGSARTRVQIDIGFGDAVTPEPNQSLYPRILDQPKIPIRTYPPQTVIAEKFHAIVVRGMLNSRMKDYYDLSLLLLNKYEHDTVSDAIRNTFSRRSTAVPDSCPVGLTDLFASDKDKCAQWNGFLKRTGITASLLHEAVTIIRRELTMILLWK